LLAGPSYGSFFCFTTVANVNPLLTDDEFNELLYKARASDSTTALDNVDTHSLLWRPTLTVQRSAETGGLDFVVKQIEDISAYL
jgi:hypothetical protein